MMVGSTSGAGSDLGLLAQEGGMQGGGSLGRMAQGGESPRAPLVGAATRASGGRDVLCEGGRAWDVHAMGRLEGVGVVAGGVRSGGMGAGGAAGVGGGGMGAGGEWELLQQLLGGSALVGEGGGGASAAPAGGGASSGGALQAQAMGLTQHTNQRAAAAAAAAATATTSRSASAAGVFAASTSAALEVPARSSVGGKRLRDQPTAAMPAAAMPAAAAAALASAGAASAAASRGALGSAAPPPPAFRDCETASGSPATTDSPATSVSALSSPSHSTSGSGGSSSGQGGGVLGKRASGGGVLGGRVAGARAGARGTEEEHAAPQGGVASGGAAGGEMMVVGGRVRGMDSFGFPRASALIGGAAGFGSGTGGGGSSYAVARELLEALPGGATGLDDLQSLQPPGSRRRTSGLYGVGAVSLDYRDAVSFNESGYSGSGCRVPWGAWEGGASGMSDQLIKGMGENAARGGNAAVAALPAAWWEARGQVGALEFPRPTAGPVSVEVTGPDVSGKFRSVEKFARAQMVAMAEAAEAGDTGRFHSAFVQLKPLGKVRGNAVERLTHYVLEGLMRRMAGTGFQHFCTPLRRPPKELDEALTLYASSQPFPLFASISVAGLVAEAVSGSTHVHIVDFGCFQPIHLPVLMDLLASRPGGPPSLRLTGMDTASFICAGRKDFKRLRAMEDVGRRLRGVARHLGVPFEFESVNVDEDNLQLLYQVKRQWHETLVVVCALELLLLPDSPNGPRHCVLRWIHDMHPTLFTFCDVDLDTNHSAFLPRFQDIVDHHLATFQFHDVFLGNADKRLLSVFEEIYFARSIINGIACEGDERVVRSERAGQWRKREVGPKDVRIRITHCGICHSDLHQVKNEWGGSQYPMVPGHEIAGVVEAVGSEVTRVAVGQRAGIGCMVDSCRTCQPCVQHVEQFCPQCVYTYNKVDPKTGESTQGGYSSFYVCDQDFVLTIPDKLPSDVAAPLLCAGITVYSPMVYYGINQAGKRLGVVGLGGLGHMAVKFGKAFGMHVTVLSTSPSKEKEAKEVMGADEFIVTKDADAMKAAVGTLDAIVDTVSAQHDLAPYLDLLTFNGKMILVGVPPEPYGLHAGQLIFGRKTVAGSLIGGINETQEMLEFCAEKGVAPMIEKIDIQDVNKAYERMLKNDVKYRFVIEIEKSLK
ncbi:unnamed protein product [Closterium sp. NIES-64]|nr:unnamed protein product [Closterium sp. NIES-64]